MRRKILALNQFKQQYGGIFLINGLLIKHKYCNIIANNIVKQQGKKGYIMLAQRLSYIKPSPTIAVTTKALELKRTGKDIITLGAGEPDFNTPDHIIEAAYKAMKDGKTRYTASAGLPEFREAVCEKLQRDNGLTYTPEQIHVGVGGKQIIFNAFLATINAGDEVVIPAPYWVSYSDIVSLFQGVPVIINGDPNNQFKITAGQLRAAITPKTKWLVLCNPSNPTGGGYTKEDLQAMGKVLEEFPNVHILSDEIYEFLVYDDFKFTAFASANPQLFDRTLTLNGLSKAYCMTGWRVGYGAGHKKLISAMNMVQSQSCTHTSTISQWAGVAALNGDHSFIAKHNARFAARRDICFDALNAMPGVSVNKPVGAFYVYPSVAGLMGKRADGQVIKNDEDLVNYFLTTANVAVVHGEAFGLSPFFRISYATSEELLHESMRRIAGAIGALQ